MNIIRLLTFVLLVTTFIPGCKEAPANKHDKVQQQPIGEFFESYYQDFLKLNPLQATQAGDNRYNNLLPNNLTVAYRDQLKNFYQKYLDSLQTFDRASLNTDEQISYDILKWDLTMGLDNLKFHEELTPVNQFNSLTLVMGQLGSGSGFQPFKMVKDYDDFLGRIDGFAEWSDTAIANMRRGMTQGYTLPKVLAERVVPQLQAMVVNDPKESIFYNPVKNMPGDFSDSDKQRLTDAYAAAISEKIIPSYNRLLVFFKDEYIPACRTTTGISDTPDGKEYYDYQATYWTTTSLTPDQIFDIGQSEVKRLRGEMENVMKQVGFQGTLKEFFHYLHTDPKFFPFKTKEEVLDAYRSIEKREEPNLKKLFNNVPKTPFEIRETEAFREASASAEYNQGSADGSRPGIFYVPIPNPEKFGSFSMEDLFLHEAIPGHHYQVSLQQENTSLPSFRRFNWYGAYGEGWALYCESLGKELGLYTDPYQYFGMLSEEMHRAIRLVVDVGMHTKGWTREQAIQFSMDNEAESEADITSEIERYMSWPGQALGYKIGQLKIIELRNKAQQELGDQFSYPEFHNQVLKTGCLPLAVFEANINEWIASQKKEKSS